MNNFENFVDFRQYGKDLVPLNNNLHLNNNLNGDVIADFIEFQIALPYYLIRDFPSN